MATRSEHAAGQQPALQRAAEIWSACFATDSESQERTVRSACIQIVGASPGQEAESGAEKSLVRAEWSSDCLVRSHDKKPVLRVGADVQHPIGRECYG